MKILRDCLFFTLSAPLLLGAGPKDYSANPDFTKGGTIPKGATHDWNLGATGARGWMFSDKMETSSARQIAITKVAPGSPAEGVLQRGDVILGVNGKAFSYDPRTEFGKALTQAEADTGRFSLLRWRDGKSERVTVTLPVLGAYCATAPFNCAKSATILKRGCAAIARKISSGESKRDNPIVRSLNALALLASGDSQYYPLVKQETEWASGFKADSMATWYYGYVLMLLSEYTMATGDKSYFEGMRRVALEAARGQSMVGSWGHKFAGEDGRLFGYGMMNAPGLPLTSGLILARKAGAKDNDVAKAIENSARLLRFYIGKGAVPYGDHQPWYQTHEDNGKCGMAAVLFHLKGEPEGAEFFSHMSLASHGSERDTGHTGNFFNIAWSMPGISLSGPQATGAWMKEFGSWYYDLARTHDGSFVHLGPPGIRTDRYGSWDSTGAYMLAYARPLSRIHLTGKDPSIIPQLDALTANDIIADGRGWSNKNRTKTYDKLTEAQLLALLSRWSPIVRERAAKTLGRKDLSPNEALIKMLSSPDLETRYGACQALGHIKDPSTGAIEALQANLKHEDLWLRIEAAEALARIGPAALVALPELLTMIARGPSPADPRGMEQRYLSFAVFGQMLRKDLTGVDRELLNKAVITGLQNEDGRARGEVGHVYDKLSYEEIKPLLPAIRDSVAKPAPSGIMFADGIRLAGLNLLAKHRIKEGIPLIFEVVQADRWGKGRRIPACLKVLGRYGSAAKPMIPNLKQLKSDLGKQRNMEKFIEQIDNLIETIEKTNKPVILRSL
ncbi:MAG: DUF6288 domain-containing protein [Akkermansiaceae bacterium]